MAATATRSSGRVPRAGPREPLLWTEEREGVQLVRLQTDRIRDTEIAALVEWIVRSVAAGRPGAIALDLSRVTMMNSTAISVLARVAEAREVHLVGLQPLVRDTLELLGLTQVMRCHPDVDAALSAMRRPDPHKRSA